MNRQSYQPGLAKQRGVVVMIMLVILVLGSASFLITALSKGDARQPDNISATAEIGAITDALIGYALANNKCLPCPDTTGDGQADVSCGIGAPVAGTLPWVTLSVGNLDSWGRRLRYVVDPDFTGSGACSITQSLQSDIVMKGRNNAGVEYDLLAPAPNPPAVVISHGTNGFGGTNELGTAMPPPPASHVDEETNRTEVTDLVQRVASDDSAITGGAFDDLIGWVGLAEYKTQLEQIYGTLPPP